MPHPFEVRLSRSDRRDLMEIELDERGVLKHACGRSMSKDLPGDCPVQAVEARPPRAVQIGAG